MLKKLTVVASVLMIIVLFVGCSPDNGISDRTYDVTIKAINSADEIIDTAVINVEGEESDQGVLEVELAEGSYTATAEDPSGNYLETERQIVVDGDEIILLHMFPDSKSVSIKPLLDNENVLDRAEVSIDGVEGNKEDGIYDFVLDIGEEYTVEITDPQGYYETTKKTFTVEKDTDSIEVNLEKAPTGTVQGNLYLSEEYNSAKLIYGEISYFDHEVISGENGFEIELPEGEREIEVDTLFGGQTKKTIDVDSDTVNNVDISVPLPDDFSEEKYRQVCGDNDVVLTRWNREPIKYYIDHLDDETERYIDIQKEAIKEATDIVAEHMTGGLVEYQKTDDINDAEVVIEITDEDTDWRGLLDEQEWEDGEIYYSKIKVRASAVNSLETGWITPAHELGHSLGFSHSEESGDLMHVSSRPDENKIRNELTQEKMVFRLLYSLEFGTENIITD